MMRASRNERGMAMVVALMVVAMLTVIVTEFTFSARIDQLMVRNGLNGMQASLLARSGIHIGEAFLLHDEDPNVDSFAEEWCPMSARGGESCQIDATNSGIVLPENMQLRIEIFDEGAKFNINLTKPANVQEYKSAIAVKSQNQGANPGNPANPAALRPFERRRLLLAEIMQGFGLTPEAIDNLTLYWEQAYQEICQGQLGLDASCGALAATPGSTQPTPGATPQGQVGQYRAPDFPSLDDVGVIPGFSPEVIDRSRRLVTAFDTTRTRFSSAAAAGGGSPINLNTASRQLLDILINDPATVDSIISQREQEPIKNAAALVQPALNAAAQDPARQGLASLFNFPTSQLFLIRASAVINANPLTGKGGIGRTASVIVRRDAKPGVGQGSPPGTPRWVLTRLSWQKEGGAVLFRPESESDLLGSEGSPSEVF